jgi:hypothetical protein
MYTECELRLERLNVMSLKGINCSRVRSQISYETHYLLLLEDFAVAEDAHSHLQWRNSECSLKSSMCPTFWSYVYGI